MTVYAIFAKSEEDPMNLGKYCAYFNALTDAGTLGEAKCSWAYNWSAVEKFCDGIPLEPEMIKDIDIPGSDEIKGSILVHAEVLDMDEFEKVEPKTCKRYGMVSKTYEL